MLWLSSADFFFKINIFKKIFQEHYNSVHFVGSDLGLVISRQQKSQLARNKINHVPTNK